MDHPILANKGRKVEIVALGVNAFAIYSTSGDVVAISTNRRKGTPKSHVSEGPLLGFLNSISSVSSASLRALYIIFGGNGKVKTVCVCGDAGTGCAPLNILIDG